MLCNGILYLLYFLQILMNVLLALMTVISMLTARMYQARTDVSARLVLKAMANHVKVYRIMIILYYFYINQ